MNSIQDQFRALQSQFRDEIETYLAAANMTPTEFGKRAANDPKFVFQVRAGRSCGAGIIDRVRAFMHDNTPDREAA